MREHCSINPIVITKPSQLFDLTEMRPDAENIWQKVQMVITRIQETSPSPFHLSPQERIRIIRNHHQSPFDPTATELQTSETSLRNSAREIFLTIHQILPPEDPIRQRIKITPKDTKKLKCLREQEERSQKNISLLNNPEISPLLTSLPQIKEALICFSYWLTIEPFLKKYDIPYSSSQIREYNRGLRNLLSGQKQHTGGLLRMAKKAVFRRWLTGKTNWQKERFNHDLINTWIQEILQTANSSLTTKNCLFQPIFVKRVNTFFRILFLEKFEKYLNSSLPYPQTPEQIFPNSCGNKTENIDDLDLVQAMQNGNQYYLFSLHQLLDQFVKNREYGYSSALDSFSLGTQFYSKNYVLAAIVAGLRFMENLLSIPFDRQNTDWQTIAQKVMTQNNGKLLKELRRATQKNNVN